MGQDPRGGHHCRVRRDAGRARFRCGDAGDPAHDRCGGDPFGPQTILDDGLGPLIRISQEAWRE